MTEAELKFLEAYSLALQGGYVKDRENWTGKDWREIARLADIHRVYPMICEAVYGPGGEREEGEGRTDPVPYARLKKALNETLAQASMSAEFLKLYTFLKQRGLAPIVMKGIVCRDLYPHPEQRSSSDEDLLIPEEMFDQYHTAFLDYGLQVADSKLDTEKEHEIPYCSGRIYIELHKSPFPPSSAAYGDLNRFFADVEERKIAMTVYGVEITVMSHTDHLFYQICHAFKHFLNCGIGIRLVSDIVLYSAAYEELIDWETVRSRCREIHAYDLTRAFYRIGEKYLLPGNFPKKLSVFWETDGVDEIGLLSDVLKGGVYGTSSSDRLHSAGITLGAMGTARSGASEASAFAEILFPSFQSMRRRYPFLGKAPLLLPFAWLHRIGRYAAESIFHKRKNGSAPEAVRIGTERVELMRRYRILEEKKKRPGLVKRLYSMSHSSFLAPVLSPLYRAVSMLEYYVLNLVWYMQGARLPSEGERELVRENVTFVAKSFERQHLAEGLCRNISRIYPGAAVVIADDSRVPLEVDLPNVMVVHLPFNSGLGAGLEKALEQVRTPYVMRMDDDELLTLKSRVHRELKYLMEHPQLDLIGFGHTTAIRLHSPDFNFREYYKCPMEDAPRRLKVPHMTRIDDVHMVLGKVANIYLARTEKIREVGLDPKIRVIDHHEFFWRAAGIIVSAAALDTVVFHRHDPYAKGYNAYRKDYAADLEYIGKKKKKMLKEVQNEKA